MGQFDYDDLKNHLNELKSKSSNPDIWKSDEAKNIFKEIKNLEKKINQFITLKKNISDIEELYKIILEENDLSLLNELKLEVVKSFQLSENLRHINLLSGKQII